MLYSAFVLIGFSLFRFSFSVISVGYLFLSFFFSHINRQIITWMSSLSRVNKKESDAKYQIYFIHFHCSIFSFKHQKISEIMLLRLWQNMQLVENTLKDHNAYRMYSNIVTGGGCYYPKSTDSIFHYFIY
jgi:hypothetical protein